MNRIANPPRRPYQSPLREHQAEETRARILEAAARVMASGLANVSVPAVAQEAGVSVPTVYRHFGSKRGLVAAVYPHLVKRAGLDKMPTPHTMAELLEAMRDYIERVDSFDDLTRAAMASPAAEESRRLSIPRRLAMMREVAGSIGPRLDEADLDRLARVLLVLTASSALRLWRDHLGASVEEVADDLEWVIRAAVDAVAREGQA